MEKSRLRKKNKNSGFTLSELVVAMALALIVAFAILSASVAIFRVVRNNTVITRITSELTETERAVNTFFYNYDAEEYEITVTEDKIIFTSSDGENTLSAWELTEKSKQINNISFEYENELKILKVEIYYEGVNGDEEEYTFILQRHSE